MPQSDRPEEYDDATYWRLVKHVRRYGGNTRFRFGPMGEYGWRVGSLFLRAFIDKILLTSSPEIHDPHGAMAAVLARKGMLGAVWHHRVVGLLLAGREWITRGNPVHRGVAVVSESKDGEMIARLWRELGGHCIRGSASKRASGALRAMVSEIKDGGGVFLTPDGPKGPSKVPKDGIFVAAALSGTPIFPVCPHFGRKVVFRRSWDRFQLPLPFGKFTYLCGEPISVPRELNDELLEAKRQELTDALNVLEERAEKLPSKTYYWGKEREG